MRIVQMILALLLLSPLSAGVAHAADIAFFPVESMTTPPEEANAIGELLAQSYASVSGLAVLAPSRISADGRSIDEQARALQVAEYVRTDAVKIGSRIVIHAVRYQADGTAIHQVKMTAERIDDMISVSDRMAKTLFFRVDDEEVRSRHNVTLHEARPEVRRWSEKVIGFKTGLHIPFARKADFTASLSAAFNLRLEMDRYFIEFGGGLLLPTRIDDGVYECDEQGCNDTATNEGRLLALSGELGASAFLTRGNIAPYVGAGLIPRLILESSGDDLAAMSPFVQAGVTLPRDSGTRFYAQTRLAQSIIALKLDNGREVYPTEAIFEAGIGW